MYHALSDQVLAADWKVEEIRRTDGHHAQPVDAVDHRPCRGQRLVFLSHSGALQDPGGVRKIRLDRSGELVIGREEVCINQQRRFSAEVQTQRFQALCVQLCDFLQYNCIVHCMSTNI